jgi:hypothetical protein
MNQRESLFPYIMKNKNKFQTTNQQLFLGKDHKKIKLQHGGLGTNTNHQVPEICQAKGEFRVMRMANSQRKQTRDYLNNHYKLYPIIRLLYCVFQQ